MKFLTCSLGLMIALGCAATTVSAQTPPPAPAEAASSGPEQSGPPLPATEAPAQATTAAAPAAQGGGSDGSAPAQSGEKKASPGHIFFVIPAYNVSYIKNVPPLTPHEKLVEFLHETYDPTGLAASGVEAALLEHDSSGFCGYGHGWGGYGKCFGAALVDGNVSGFIGDYLLPTLWHQDPRYFRLGTGSVGTRLLYSVVRVFVARKDDGTGWTFASAPLTGTFAAGAISNLYYPKADRGWGLSLSRIAIDLSGTAIFNIEAEFWPDVQRIVFHRKPTTQP